MQSHIWSMTLANYGQAVGTMFVTGALLDWRLADRQRQRITDCSQRLWGLAAEVRQRRLVGQFDRPQVQQLFLTAILAAEALAFWVLGHRVGYAGHATSVGDLALRELVLFAAPFGISATVLMVTGPRLVVFLTRGGDLLACTGRCLAVALAADLAGYGTLRLVETTLGTFGPRAMIDWWDVGLWIYGGEYALSGIVLSAMAIAQLMLAICVAAWLGLCWLALSRLQHEFVWGVIRRVPKQSLLGSSITLAGLAILAKDWL
jgi:hypothetical protein